MVIGADVAINHAALVNQHGEVLHYFDDGNGMLSTTEQLYEKAVELANATPKSSVVVIDFDRDQGSWGPPKVGILITMQVAFYGALITATRDCQVHYVTPALVRYCLGLPNTTSKKDLHIAVHKMYPDTVYIKDPHGDKMDAWVLAVTYECAREEFSL